MDTNSEYANLLQTAQILVNRCDQSLIAINDALVTSTLDNKCLHIGDQTEKLASQIKTAGGVIESLNLKSADEPYLTEDLAIDPLPVLANLDSSLMNSLVQRAHGATVILAEYLLQVHESECKMAAVQDLTWDIGGRIAELDAFLKRIENAAEVAA